MNAYFRGERTKPIQRQFVSCTAEFEELDYSQLHLKRCLTQGRCSITMPGVAVQERLTVPGPEME